MASDRINMAVLAGMEDVCGEQRLIAAVIAQAVNDATQWTDSRDIRTVQRVYLHRERAYEWLRDCSLGTVAFITPTHRNAEEVHEMIMTAVDEARAENALAVQWARSRLALWTRLKERNEAVKATVRKRRERKETGTS